MKTKKIQEPQRQLSAQISQGGELFSKVAPRKIQKQDLERPPSKSWFQRIKQKFIHVDVENTLSNEQKKQIEENKLRLIEKVVNFLMVSNFFYQLASIKYIINPQSEEQPIVLISYWCIWFIAAGLMVLQKVKGRIEMVKYTLAILIARNIIPLLDFEGKKFFQDQGKFQFFILLQQSTVAFLMICFNFVSSTREKIVVSTTFLSIMVFGIIKQNNQSIESFLMLFFNSLLGLMFMDYTLSFGEVEVMKAVSLNNNMQRELIQILESLEEAIITKLDDEIKFRNMHGDKIIQNILNQKVSDEIVNEQSKTILESQCFQVFEEYNDGHSSKNNTWEKGGPSTDMDKKKYSMNQLFEMEAEELQNKIFTIMSFQDPDDCKEPTSSANEEDPSQSEKKQYVQIKHTKISNGFEILQVIDMSSQIKINITNGEKKLLSLINATVSHEMRNPLNSIYSQNQKLNQVSERLAEFIESDIENHSKKEIRKKLNFIKTEYIESIKICSASTKILNFLVNDMLDFAQMRSGKFRKDVCNFDIREAIQEIINVQKLKADFQGIDLSCEMVNFPMKQEPGIIKSQCDYIVCSDIQRVQQVILNLQSNALKFTPSGGRVLITCTLIRKVEELKSQKHHEFFEKSSGYGMIEIQVKDTGTGIKEADQSKLFKLFGFLDSTAKLNSKGVGLGLHISQKISEQFGGKIILESEFGHGSNFIFLIDLDEKQEHKDNIKRHLNPIKRTYPKITVSDDTKRVTKNYTSVNLVFSFKKSIEIVQKYQEKVQQKIEKKNLEMSPLFSQPVGCKEIDPFEDIVIVMQPTPREGVPDNHFNSFEKNNLELYPSDSSSEEEDNIKSVLANGLRRVGNSKEKRILLVDDEPYNLIGLKIVLEAADKHGIVYKLVDQVTNGLEAYEAVKNAYLEGNFQYGLIFMDCSMPIMDGYQATDKIRGLKNIQQPMIVACTGHSENEYIKKAWRHQMDEIVAKPANIEVLRCILNEMIEYKK